MHDNESTKLTLEHNGTKFIAELPWDANMDDLTNAFYALCIGATFNPSTVLDGMGEWLAERTPSLLNEDICQSRTDDDE